MRVEGCALPALSDCWENKAVIRDWESIGAYLSFFSPFFLMVKTGLRGGGCGDGATR